MMLDISTLPDEVQDAFREVMEVAFNLENLLADYDYNVTCLAPIHHALDTVVEAIQLGED